MPAPSGAPLIGEQYALDRVLGRGAMGEVYLARELGSGLRVAIKIASARHPEAHDHFEREMELSALMDHDHVVDILDYGWTGAGSERAPYLVMELLHGHTLREHLNRTGSLEVLGVVDLIRQAALGLDAAHQAGIVHRDVKPDNLFLHDDPSAPGRPLVKVLDFGLATRSGEVPAQTGMVVGTVEYMAPEQIVSEPVDCRTDIYSLGVVMFRLLTGELPFDLALKSELLAHQLMSPAPPLGWLRDVPPGLERIVRTALNKHPENRYPDMRSLVTDLIYVLEGKGDEIGPRTMPYSPDEFAPASEFGLNAMARLRRVQRASGLRYRSHTPHQLRLRQDELDAADAAASRLRSGS